MEIFFKLVLVREREFCRAGGDFRAPSAAPIWKSRNMQKNPCFCENCHNGKAMDGAARNVEGGRLLDETGLWVECAAYHVYERDVTDRDFYRVGTKL